jgi:hypothetical protein
MLMNAYLRLRFKLLHDVKEIVVDRRLVSKLQFDLVQVGQSILYLQPLELLLLLLTHASTRQTTL